MTRCVPSPLLRGSASLFCYGLSSGFTLKAALFFSSRFLRGVWHCLPIMTTKLSTKFHPFVWHGKTTRGDRSKEWITVIQRMQETRYIHNCHILVGLASAWTIEGHHCLRSFLDEIIFCLVCVSAVAALLMLLNRTMCSCYCYSLLVIYFL